MDEYNFEEIVNELYEKLNDNKNNENNNNILVLPKNIIEYTTTKIYWKNVNEYLNIINRDSNHFFDFLKNELQNQKLNWYSSDITEGIVFHNKNKKQNDISNLCLKYINIYVICSSCKKNNSILNKNNRYYDFECLNCGFKKNFK